MISFKLILSSKNSYISGQLFKLINLLHYTASKSVSIFTHFTNLNLEVDMIQNLVRNKKHASENISLK